MTTTAQLDRFTAAYREAVEFTDTGDTEQPPTGTPWAAYGLSETERDCSAFLAALSPRSWAFITSTDARLTQAGHDFWLTRQGHGTGFWDREDHVAGLCDCRGRHVTGMEGTARRDTQHA
jgi:hypothetical protein